MNSKYEDVLFTCCKYGRSFDELFFLKRHVLKVEFSLKINANIVLVILKELMSIILFSLHI